MKSKAKSASPVHLILSLKPSIVTTIVTSFGGRHAGSALHLISHHSKGGRCGLAPQLAAGVRRPCSRHHRCGRCISPDLAKISFRSGSLDRQDRSQPTRQMAESVQSHSLASPHCVAELSPVEPCLAPRPYRALTQSKNTDSPTLCASFAKCSRKAKGKTRRNEPASLNNR